MKRHISRWHRACNLARMKKKSSMVEVSGPQGLHGTIDTAAWPLDGSRDQIEILFDDGQRVRVARDVLERVDARHYRIPTAAAALLERDRSGSATTSEAAVVVPVIQEHLNIGKRTVESGRVRVRKVVREVEETIDQPLAREEVTIERVPVGRIVEGPQQARQEGDDWIIPVVEEVLVVEKRLMLKEELHVRKRTVQERHHQRVTLQHEEPVIERLPAQGAPVEDASGAVEDAPRPPGSAGFSKAATQENGTTIAADRTTRA
jgi:uncharacterized protein (TIGR02271 family)